MLGNQLFLDEWGVWFCFAGQPGDDSQKYQQNFELVFALRGPADLGYCWSHFGLGRLDGFLATGHGLQQRYAGD